MNHGSLFSGIGGFDLASEWMGWNNIFHCEWNPFGQKVLNYYWPKAISYNDIAKTDFTIHRGQIDILTGGFPCQPYSVAGKRLGKEDDRHLWPEMLRAIREVQPRYIVGENVSGLINWNGGMVFDEVQADLEVEGYEVQPYILPAAGVNAPHRRDRVWFVAYSDQRFSEQQKGEIQAGRNTFERSSQFDASNANGNERPEGWMHTVGQKEAKRHAGSCDARGNGWKAWKNFPTQSPICDGNDGISSRLDGITFPKWRNESIKAGGNAIVPQIVYQIFKSIENFQYL